MKKTKENLMLIISSMLVIILVSIFIFFLSLIKQKNQYASGLSVTIEQKLIDNKNAENLKNRMEELGDTSKKLKSYFVNTNNIDSFVEYLENLGDSNKVELIVKNVKVLESENNIISVDLKINGDFPTIIKVLDLMENAPYSITINTTYLNKMIIEDIPIDNINNKNKEILKEKNPKWEASISFNVLSL